MMVLSFATFVVEDMFWLFAGILVASTVLFMMEEDDFTRRSRYIAFSVHALALIIMVTYVIAFLSIQ